MNNAYQNTMSHELTRWDVYRGLLWYEWHKQKWVHITFLVIFLILTATYAIYITALLNLFGLIYGIAAGETAGLSGEHDELKLALPPLRYQSFFIPFVVGIGPIFLILAIWMSLLETVIPQHLGGLFGFTYDLSRFGSLDTLQILAIVTFSFAQFCTFFAICINKRSDKPRGRISILWSIIPYIVFGITTECGKPYSLQGLLPLFGNLAFCSGSLYIGYSLYRQKEVSVASSILSKTSLRVFRIVAIVSLVILFANLLIAYIQMSSMSGNIMLSILPFAILVVIFFILIRFLSRIGK